MKAGKTPVNGHDPEEESSRYPLPREKRKKVVVVGLGMVGIAFIEKLIKMDSKRREYDVVVVGEEPHLAYNRVGLTSFFQHRKVENLYLNQKDWVSLGLAACRYNRTATDLFYDSILACLTAL